MIGTPLTDHYPVATGQMHTARVGDREWAYLFIGEELQVYQSMRGPQHRARWLPCASWPVADLPQIAVAELTAVDRRKQRLRERAADIVDYCTAICQAAGGQR